jgi:hypothetical protein
MADRLALEASVVCFVFEHEVDDTRKFFGNDRTGDRLVGATEDLLVEVPVLREVLNGMDGHVGEGDFEVLVAVFAAGFVSDGGVGVPGAGDKAAVGDEVLVASR